MKRYLIFASLLASIPLAQAMRKDTSEATELSKATARILFAPRSQALSQRTIQAILVAADKISGMKEAIRNRLNTVPGHAPVEVIDAFLQNILFDLCKQINAQNPMLALFQVLNETTEQQLAIIQASYMEQQFSTHATSVPKTHP